MKRTKKYERPENTRPFCAEEALQGAPVMTRCGLRAVVEALPEKVCGYALQGTVEGVHGVLQWADDGRWSHQCETSLDLYMMVEGIPVEKCSYCSRAGHADVPCPQRAAEAERFARMGAPVPDGVTGTEARVCMDISRRQAMGITKYGTTVEANPLPLHAWIRHAYEECLDKAVYLRRAMEEMEQDAGLISKTEEL